MLPNAPDYIDAEPPVSLEASMPRDEPPLLPEFGNDVVFSLFSEHEGIPEVTQTQYVLTATAEAKVPLADTSAKILTNPSLTDVPNSIPKTRNCT